jgi:hypothetical protein
MATEVGDPSIMEGWRDRSVPVLSGGTVGDDMPFSFGPRSPMVFRIACGCRDAIPGRNQGGDRLLVYFAARVSTVVGSGFA